MDGTDLDRGADLWCLKNKCDNNYSSRQ